MLCLDSSYPRSHDMAYPPLTHSSQDLSLLHSLYEAWFMRMARDTGVKRPGGMRESMLIPGC